MDNPSTDVAPADAAYVREHYTKYEYLVPMRDGVRLMTAVYIPKDDRKTYPILLSRTPYGLRPYGIDNLSREPGGLLRQYARAGFIFATQDVRGQFGSEGDFEHIRPHNPDKNDTDIDEASDTYDTVAWLIDNVPLNNGKVGLSGISYGGFYAVHGLIDAHPALKCVSPQAPMVDWFIGDDFHHNGVFYLSAGFGFLAHFGQRLEDPTRQFPRPFDFATPDGYEFYLNLGPIRNIPERLTNNTGYWDILAAHGTYDEYWQERTPLPHLQSVKPAVLTVGGWFDAEDLYGPLSVYRKLATDNPDTSAHLVMGPWTHGGWHRNDGDTLGHVRFDQKTSVFFRREIELPWLNYHLKDGPSPELPAATVFETGTNQWRRYDAWPPTNATETRLYLAAAGGLTFDQPTSDDHLDELAEHEEYDEYVSDPMKPVPFVPNITVSMTQEHMIDDQRFAATRPDVLVYQTPPLTEDRTVAGPILVDLRVATSGTDSDWVVKLIDVYPGDYPNPEPNPKAVRMGGYQQLVRGEAFRGKFRNGFDQPEPFEPNEPTTVAYDMPDIYHTFRRGHRIMVQIQSSWFPMVDRNPQTFCDIYSCGEDAFVKATQRVYRSRDLPSAVVLQVVR